jgi:hypothetical protein
MENHRAVLEEAAKASSVNEKEEILMKSLVYAGNKG